MRRKSLDSLGREWYIAGTVATTTYIYLNPETLDQQLQTEFEWLVFQSSQSEWSSCLTFAAVATTNTSSASVCVQLILTIVDCQLRHVASCCGVQCSEMPARNSNVVPGSCHFLEHLSFCIVTKIPSSPSVHRHSRRWDMASSTKLHRMNKWCGPMAILRLGISKACDGLRGHHWHHWKLASFQQTHSIAKRHHKQKLHWNPPSAKNPHFFSTLDSVPIIQESLVDVPGILVDQLGQLKVVGTTFGGG